MLQIFFVNLIVKYLATSSWSSCTTFIAKVEDSSNKCKFFNIELLSYLLYSKYLGYLTIPQVLICFLYIKRSLSFKFIFEKYHFKPRTTSLELHG